MKPQNYFPCEIKLRIKRSRQDLNKKEVGWEVELYGRKHSDYIKSDDNLAAICAAVNLMAEQATAVISERIKFEEAESERI